MFKVSLTGPQFLCCSFVTLFETSTELGDGILSCPTHLLPIFDSALYEAQKAILSKESSKGDFILKSRVHARLTGKVSYLVFEQK